MILDKVFYGVLDQGRGCLLVFDEPEADVSFYFFGNLSLQVFIRACLCPQNTYGAAIQTLEQVGKVVESLYAKVNFIPPCATYILIICLDCDYCVDYIRPFLL